jgi:two-component system sensor histidine kinase HydH
VGDSIYNWRMEHFFDEIKRYVAFSQRDEERLAILGPVVQPHIHRIIDDFYDCILRHPDAGKAITEGPAQVERLKGTLRLWLQELFLGPWDLHYYEKRARIGRRHVQIQLPQQYMFTAVNVIRGHIVDILLSVRGAEANQEIRSVDKLLDLELAIMLHTYRESYTEKMKQNERLIVYGHMAASIAHELRNPLGVIESSAFLLRRRLPPDFGASHHIDKIEGQVQHANQVISTLLDMVRDTPLRAEPVDVLALATTYQAGLPEAKQGRLSVEAEGDTFIVWADRTHVLQIIENLLNNAFEATQERVLVKIYKRDGAVYILINDSGKGIDSKLRVKIFEPLFTTKSRGIGLGLSLSRKLAERNGGSLTLTEGPLQGAAFLLILLEAPEENRGSYSAGG